MMDHRSLPDKLYFKIGEVSEIAGVPSYVLRFWETEFKRIKPMRTDSGQRLYRKKDVKLVLKIKHLLYEKKFTIQGANQFLKKSTKAPSERLSIPDLNEIREELKSIRALLDRHKID
jgi:DNA-binding transcriptional MerR regulator